MMTFDRKLARLLLEICRYTYAIGFDDQKNATDKDNAFKKIEEISGYSIKPIALHGSNTSFACVFPYPDRNIVSYMGTKTQFDTIENIRKSLDDWQQNFEALLVPFQLTSDQLGKDHPQDVNKDNLGGLVHKGFLEELASVQQKVVETLLEHGGRSRPVYITGHSQGGAEAALATRALLAGGFPVVSTYTFAAPRSGNLAFTKSIPATLPIHRIEFGDDIVPHVPPTLITKEIKKIVKALETLAILTSDTKKLLEFIQLAGKENGFVGLGTLCYGSNKTKALRVDLSTSQEAELFYDRLWSLIRHPENWAEHHHLAGTNEEVKHGKEGNYTALVSNFTLVN